MNASATPLSVSIRELAPVHVATVDFRPIDAPSDLYPEIRSCFQRVQAWVKKLGHDPTTSLTVGVPAVVDGRPSSYRCCVQVPENVQNGSEGVDIMELPGGRYAVESIEKDPQIIGESIGRFYQEYVPQNQIQIDGARPTYEIYYESTMEYCVPMR